MPARSTAHKWLQQAPAVTPSAAAPNRLAALPSPKQLAWPLVQQPAASPPIGAAAVTRVEQDKEAAWATEVDVAVHTLNRMLELGRPISVRIA